MRQAGRSEVRSAIDNLIYGQALSLAGVREEYDAAIAAGDDGKCKELAEKAGIPFDALGIEKPKATAAGVVFTRVGDRLAAGLKPIAWLVRGYVEADSLALLFGDPNCGKSFVAIDMACCIATGREWHGRKTKRGAVFYIAGEGQNGLDRRFAAWSQGNDISLTDAPLFTSSRPAMLCTAAGAADVANAVQSLLDETGELPSLIVVDTLARNFGGDENSTEDMGAFVANLDAFLRKSGEWNAAVLVVHHCGKADKTQGRGNSALRGAIDAEYSLAIDDEKVIRMDATKMKDAAYPGALAFKMNVIELDGEFDDEGEPVTSVVLDGMEHVPPVKGGKVGRGKNQTRAISMLRDLIEEHRRRVSDSGRDPGAARVSMNEWRARMGNAGMNRFQVRDVVDGLRDKGVIVLELGGFVSIAPDA